MTVPTLAVALVWLGAARAWAELPDAATLLADLGLTSDEIAEVQAGEFVRYAVQPASERELVAGLAFQVSVPPGELVKSSKEDPLDRVDPNVIAYGVIAGDGSSAHFTKSRFSRTLESARGPTSAPRQEATSIFPQRRSRRSANWGAEQRSPSWSRRSGARCSRGSPPTARKA